MLNQTTLRELLDYQPDTGKLYWKTRDRKWFKSDQDYRKWNTRYANKPALNSINKNGYLEGTLFGRKVRTHRIIWMWMTGTMPLIIDHEDHNPLNNKWLNLRNGDSTLNNRNKKLQRNSTTGFTGVSFHKRAKKYRAYIKVGNKRKHLGFHASPELAHLAFETAKLELNFSKSHGL